MDCFGRRVVPLRMRESGPVSHATYRVYEADTPDYVNIFDSGDLSSKGKADED